MSEGISFTSFIVSLATGAAMHMGDIPDPSGGQPPKDLAAASEMIDLLVLLKEKTTGNLTPEEAQVLDQVLYELQMRFVQLKEKPTIIIP